MKNWFKFNRRLVSAFILTAFLFSHQTVPLSYAASVPTLPAANQKKFSNPDEVTLPKEFGKIQETFKGSRGQTVVLIQDAHAIPDAQRSIQKIIDHFQKEYGFNLTAIEGAALELDPQIFRSFPDQETLKKVFDEYMERGEVTGSTAAAIFNPSPAIYRGIEDWPLYEKGLELYQKAMEREAEIQNRLQDAGRKLQEEKNKIYSPQLLELDKSLQDFQSNQTNLIDALKKLAAIKPPKKGTELALILEEMEQDSKNQTSEEIEVKKMAEQIKRVLPEERLTSFNDEFQKFKTSQVSAREFAVFLEGIASKANMPFKVSARLAPFLENQKRMQDIEGTKLFKDFEKYLRVVKGSLFRNDQERELDQKSRELELLGRLSRLELSQEDWNEVKTARTKRGVEWIADRKNAKDFLNAVFFTRSTLNAHFAFYENAYSRDEAFFENLMAFMKEENAKNSLLITGGFHAENLMRKFEEQGISYLLITPGIDAIPENSHYREHMRGDVSWKNYFKIENGKVNLYKAFVRGTRDRLLGGQKSEVRSQTSDLLPQTSVLKPWRDRIIRDLAERGKIARAREYTSFIDEAASKTQNSKSLPEWRSKLEKFITDLRGLESKGSLTEQNILKLFNPSMNADITSASLVATGPSISEARLPVLMQTSSELRSPARETIPETIELKNRSEARVLKTPELNWLQAFIKFILGLWKRLMQFSPSNRQPRTARPNLEALTERIAPAVVGMEPVRERLPVDLTPVQTAEPNAVPFENYLGPVKVAAGDTNGDGLTDNIFTALGHVLSGDSKKDEDGGLNFFPFGNESQGTEINIGLGDVNGDRKDEIFASLNGALQLHDGTTGEKLASFDPFPGYKGEVRLGAGDLDGDGKMEVIVGTGGEAMAHVKAFRIETSELGIPNGNTHEVFSQFVFDNYAGGVSVAGGDLNGDGKAEIIAGADTNAHVRAFNATGELERSFIAYREGDAAGVAARVSSGDFNSDGRADIVVGSNSNSHVVIFDGETNELLASLIVHNVPTPQGVYVAGSHADTNKSLETLIVSAPGLTPVQYVNSATFTREFPATLTLSNVPPETFMSLEPNAQSTVLASATAQDGDKILVYTLDTFNVIKIVTSENKTLFFPLSFQPIQPVRVVADPAGPLVTFITGEGENLVSEALNFYDSKNDIFYGLSSFDAKPDFVVGPGTQVSYRENQIFFNTPVNVSFSQIYATTLIVPSSGTGLPGLPGPSESPVSPGSPGSPLPTPVPQPPPVPGAPPTLLTLGAALRADTAAPNTNNLELITSYFIRQGSRTGTDISVYRNPAEGANVIRIIKPSSFEYFSFPAEAQNDARIYLVGFESAYFIAISNAGGRSVNNPVNANGAPSVSFLAYDVSGNSLRSVKLNNDASINLADNVIADDGISNNNTVVFTSAAGQQFTLKVRRSELRSQKLLDFRKIRLQLETIAESRIDGAPATALRPAHVDKVISLLKSGELKLRGEEIDVLGVRAEMQSGKEGEAPRVIEHEFVIGSLDRALAKLFYAPGGDVFLELNRATARQIRNKKGRQLPFGVAFVVVINDAGDFAFVRGINKDRIGEISFTGGHVASGETYRAAAFKEVRQEMGFRDDYVLNEKNMDQIGADGEFQLPDKIFGGRGSLFVYKTTKEEWGEIEKFASAINLQRETSGLQTFLAILRELQKKPGQGEVAEIVIVRAADAGANGIFGLPENEVSSAISTYAHAIRKFLSKSSELRAEVKVEGIENIHLKEGPFQQELYDLLVQQLKQRSFIVDSLRAVNPEIKTLDLSQAALKVSVDPILRQGNDRNIVLIHIDVDGAVYSVGLAVGRTGIEQRMWLEELAQINQSPLMGAFMPVNSSEVNYGLLPVQWIQGKTIHELLNEGQWEQAYQTLLQVELNLRRRPFRIKDIRENLKNIMRENDGGKAYIVDVGIQGVPHTGDSLYEVYQAIKKGTPEFSKTQGSRLAEVTEDVLKQHFLNPAKAAAFLKRGLAYFEAQYLDELAPESMIADLFPADIAFFTRMKEIKAEFETSSELRTPGVIATLSNERGESRSELRVSRRHRILIGAVVIAAAFLGLGVFWVWKLAYKKSGEADQQIIAVKTEKEKTEKKEPAIQPVEPRKEVPQQAEGDEKAKYPSVTWPDLDAELRLRIYNNQIENDAIYAANNDTDGFLDGGGKLHEVMRDKNPHKPGKPLILTADKGFVFTAMNDQPNIEDLSILNLKFKTKAAGTFKIELKGPKDELVTEFLVPVPNTKGKEFPLALALRGLDKHKTERHVQTFVIVDPTAAIEFSQATFADRNIFYDEDKASYNAQTLYWNGNEYVEAKEIKGAEVRAKAGVIDFTPVADMIGDHPLGSNGFYDGKGDLLNGVHYYTWGQTNLKQIERSRKTISGGKLRLPVLKGEISADFNKPFDLRKAPVVNLRIGSWKAGTLELDVRDEKGNSILKQPAPLSIPNGEGDLMRLSFNLKALIKDNAGEAAAVVLLNPTADLYLAEGTFSPDSPLGPEKTYVWTDKNKFERKTPAKVVVKPVVEPGELKRNFLAEGTNGFRMHDSSLKDNRAHRLGDPLVFSGNGGYAGTAFDKPAKARYLHLVVQTKKSFNVNLELKNPDDKLISKSKIPLPLPDTGGRKKVISFDLKGVADQEALIRFLFFSGLAEPFTITSGSLSDEPLSGVKPMIWDDKEKKFAQPRSELRSVQEIVSRDMEYLAERIKTLPLPKRLIPKGTRTKKREEITQRYRGIVSVAIAEFQARISYIEKADEAVSQASEIYYLTRQTFGAAALENMGENLMALTDTALQNGNPVLIMRVMAYLGWNAWLEGVKAYEAKGAPGNPWFTASDADNRDEIINLLLEQFETENLENVHMAAFALSQIEGGSERVTQIAQYENLRTRILAGQDLSELETVRAFTAVPGLIQRLQGGYSFQAVQALRHIGPAAEPTIPDLIHLLNTVPNTETQSWIHIIAALTNMGPAAALAVSKLQDIFRDQDVSTGLRINAAQALVRIGFSKEELVSGLVAIQPQVTGVNNEYNTLNEILGQTGSLKAAKVLLRNLGHKYINTGQVIEEALRALGPKALPVIFASGQSPRFKANEVTVAGLKGFEALLKFIEKDSSGQGLLIWNALPSFPPDSAVSIIKILLTKKDIDLYLRMVQEKIEERFTESVISEIVDYVIEKKTPLALGVLVKIFTENKRELIYKVLLDKLGDLNEDLRNGAFRIFKEAYDYGLSSHQLSVASGEDYSPSSLAVPRENDRGLGKIKRILQIEILLRALGDLVHEKLTALQRELDSEGTRPAVVPDLLLLLIHADMGVQKTAFDILKWTAIIYKSRIFLELEKQRAEISAAGPALLNKILELLEKDEDFENNKKVYSALFEFLQPYESSAVPALAALLGGKDKSVRKKASEVLIEMTPESSMPALIEVFKKADPQNKTDLSKLFGQMGKKAGSASEVLIQALEDADAIVQELSAESLGKIGKNFSLRSRERRAIVKALTSKRGKSKDEVLTAVEGALESLRSEIRSDARSEFRGITSASELRTAAQTLVDFVQGKPLSDSGKKNAARTIEKVKVKATVGELRELLSEMDQQELTGDYQVFKAGLGWIGSVLGNLDQSLLVALNINVDEKEAFEAGVENLEGKEKLVALLPLALGEIEVEGISVVPVKNLNSYRLSGIKTPVMNPENIPAVGGDGSSVVSGRGFFNVRPAQASEQESLYRKSFDLLGRLIIGAAVAYVRAQNPGLQGEPLKQKVADLIFKQYPDFADADSFKIDLVQGRIEVLVDQNSLWNVAKKIAADYASQSEMLQAA